MPKNRINANSVRRNVIINAARFPDETERNLSIRCCYGGVYQSRCSGCISCNVEWLKVFRRHVDTCIRQLPAGLLWENSGNWIKVDGTTSMSVCLPSYLVRKMVLLWKCIFGKCFSELEIWTRDLENLASRGPTTGITCASFGSYSFIGPGDMAFTRFL